jgi:peroxiredoxin
MQTNKRIGFILILVLGGVLSMLSMGELLTLPQLQTSVEPAKGSDPPPTPAAVMVTGTGESLRIGRPAPDFTLPTFEGEKITLSNLKGQAILINFWTTWCPPCRLEMPDLADAYMTHREDGFVVLAVNLTPQDNREAIKAFAEEFDLPFPILLDETGKVANDLYRVRGLPISVFVDREGVVTHVEIGMMTGQQIEQYLAEALR